MLRNEVYIGKLYQFKRYHVEPKFRLNPSPRSKKTSSLLRPKDEWILVKVPPLIPIELFEAVQRKLKTNAELSKRNTKRQYLLSGVLYCSQCGGRMGGHTIHGVPYYHCYRKGLYADFMMRDDMELIQKEQGELEKRKAELERQLAQRQLTQGQEAQIRSLAERIGIGLNNLDFTGKQEILRLLVEKVLYNGQGIEILTIIPLGEQLHPIHRGGLRGRVTYFKHLQCSLR